MKGSIIGESIPRIQFSFKRDHKVVKMDRSELENRCDRTFQEKIVRLIVRKFYKKEIEKLTEEQISEYIRNNYAKICNEILQEEPIRHNVSTMSTH